MYNTVENFKKSTHIKMKKRSIFEYILNFKFYVIYILNMPFSFIYISFITETISSQNHSLVTEKLMRPIKNHLLLSDTTAWLCGI